MGLLSRILGRLARPRRAGAPRFTVDTLADRLGMTVGELQRITPAYHTFAIPKRTGGLRTLHAPDPPFKHFQRRLHRRVLARLPVHPAAAAYVPGRSIAHHALLHAARAVVVRLDLQDFFPSTTAQRVADYFRVIGYDAQAAALLTTWCTHEGGLPQGAPTSPVLANAVNFRLDAALASALRRIARNAGHYSRYADDLTFSFDTDDHAAVNPMIHAAKDIAGRFGYRVHHHRKLRIMRRHHRQQVCGLVINAGVHLPREQRRLLRAARHHAATGRPCTLTPAQLEGWAALEGMLRRAVGGGRSGGE